LALARSAIEGGSNTLVQTLDAAARQEEPLDAELVKPLIIQSVSRGLNKAAEIVATELMETPLYGFTQQDARYALDLLAATGDAEAIVMAALATAQGTGSEPDVDAARDNLTALAESGELDADTIYRVARGITKIGLAPAEAATLAAPLYLEVANGGSARAAYQLGKLVFSSDETVAASAQRTIDGDRAITLLQRTADAPDIPDPNLLVLLGDIYRKGLAGAVDDRGAMEVYEAALTLREDDETKAKLLKSLRNNLTDRDRLRRYWSVLEELAGRDHPWSQKELGSALLKGERLLIADPERGLALLEASYASGYEPAASHLARYLASRGDEASVQRAVTIFAEDWGRRRSVTAGVNLAETYVELGELEEAEAILNDPLLAQSHDAKYLLAKLILERAPGDADEVRRAATALVAALDLVDPVNPRGRTYAKALLDLNDPSTEQRAVAELSAYAQDGDEIALSELIPFFLARLEDDPQAFDRLAELTLIEAERGRTANLVRLIRPFLKDGVDQTLARQSAELAKEALELSPQDSDLPMLLSLAYEQGYGVPRNAADARRYMERAATNGARDAQVELAIAYLYGLDYERDPQRAVELLKRAEAQGSNKARIELGRLYSTSAGPSLDPARAFFYFNAAAEAGSLTAMTQLGKAYMSGSGVSQDMELGLATLKRAAEAGEPDAMYQLYFHFAQQTHPQAGYIAIDWLRRAAAAGVLTAKLRYAIHLREKDEEQNRELVIAILRDAVANGHNLSRKYLVQHYRDSVPVGPIAPSETYPNPYLEREAL
ncbi:MAG: tetratricopeptide repeat protein, partial [Pseudomonadota bacterium]